MSTKVLLTGISGWIAKHTAIELLKAGYEVLIICSTPAFTPAFKTLKVPSTAGGNRRSLFLETFIGKGEAM